MKKIITLFQRNYSTDHLVRDELVPGAEWVAAGEGFPTRKVDGTCCLVRGGKLYKRFELKSGRLEPRGFERAQEPDPVTGDCPGWVPVGDGPEDRWHRQAFDITACLLPDGTYELCGPKVQANAEGYLEHVLLRHGYLLAPDTPRTFEGLRNYLEAEDLEGIVWHHPDGRMVKIKKKDFGFKRRESNV